MKQFKSFLILSTLLFSMAGQAAGGGFLVKIIKEGGESVLKTELGFDGADAVILRSTFRRMFGILDTTIANMDTASDAALTRALKAAFKEVPQLEALVEETSKNAIDQKEFVAALNHGFAHLSQKGGTKSFKACRSCISEKLTELGLKYVIATTPRAIELAEQAFRKIDWVEMTSNEIAALIKSDDFLTEIGALTIRKSGRRGKRSIFKTIDLVNAAGTKIDQSFVGELLHEVTEVDTMRNIVAMLKVYTDNPTAAQKEFIESYIEFSRSEAVGGFKGAQGLQSNDALEILFAYQTKDDEVVLSGFAKMLREAVDDVKANRATSPEDAWDQRLLGIANDTSGKYTNEQKRLAKQIRKEGCHMGSKS